MTDNPNTCNPDEKAFNDQPKELKSINKRTKDYEIKEHIERESAVVQFIKENNVMRFKYSRSFL